jgi:hypothetical protein
LTAVRALGVGALRSVTQIRQKRVYVTPKNHERREVNIDPELLTPSGLGGRCRLPSA